MSGFVSLAIFSGFMSSFVLLILLHFGLQVFHPKKLRIGMCGRKFSGEQ